MSKKKNTLKDLDEFLKQQAASLAPTSQLSEKIKEPESHTDESTVIATTSMDNILVQLNTLSQEENHRLKLYDLIIRHLESLKNPQAEDVMLINTALYLKHTDNWKEAIRSYWKKRIS